MRDQDVQDSVQLKGEANAQAQSIMAQAQSIMVMAMLALHPRPHQVMRRFRDLLEIGNDPSDDAIVECLRSRAGPVPSTLEQLLHALQNAERTPAQPQPDAEVVRGHETLRMHDLFLAALLSAHPQPQLIRGLFRTVLAGLTDSHARYAFDESFLLPIRRSALRLDSMMELVTAAHETRVTEQPATGGMLTQARPRAGAKSAVRSAH